MKYDNEEEMGAVVLGWPGLQGADRDFECLAFQISPSISGSVDGKSHKKEEMLPAIKGGKKKRWKFKRIRKWATMCIIRRKRKENMHLAPMKINSLVRVECTTHGENRREGAQREGVECFLPLVEYRGQEETGDQEKHHQSPVLEQLAERAPPVAQSDKYVGNYSSLSGSSTEFIGSTSWSQWGTLSVDSRPNRSALSGDSSEIFEEESHPCRALPVGEIISPAFWKNSYKLCVKVLVTSGHFFEGLCNDEGDDLLGPPRSQEVSDTMCADMNVILRDQDEESEEQQIYWSLVDKALAEPFLVEDDALLLHPTHSQEFRKLNRRCLRKAKKEAKLRQVSDEEQQFVPVRSIAGDDCLFLTFSSVTYSESFNQDVEEEPLKEIFDANKSKNKKKGKKNSKKKKKNKKKSEEETVAAEEGNPGTAKKSSKSKRRTKGNVDEFISDEEEEKGKYEEQGENPESVEGSVSDVVVSTNDQSEEGEEGREDGLSSRNQSDEGRVSIDKKSKESGDSSNGRKELQKEDRHSHSKGMIKLRSRLKILNKRLDGRDSPSHRSLMDEAEDEDECNEEFEDEYMETRMPNKSFDSLKGTSTHSQLSSCNTHGEIVKLFSYEEEKYPDYRAVLVRTGK